MANLFDKIMPDKTRTLKPELTSPPDGSVPVPYSSFKDLTTKYIDWQKNRNIGQEIEAMKNDPMTVLNFINPAGGLSNVKSFLKSGEKAHSASWISNSGREYLLSKKQTHEKFAKEMQKLFDVKDELNLFDKGWIRKAYSGNYSIAKIDNKTINLIRKNIVKDKNIKDKVYIDIYKGGYPEKSFTADTDKFIKYGKGVLKEIEKDVTDGPFLPWELEDDIKLDNETKNALAKIWKKKDEYAAKIKSDLETTQKQLETLILKLKSRNK